VIPMTEKSILNHSESVYWLTLINESGLKLSRIKPIIQRWCVVEARPLAAIFNLSPLDWTSTFGLSEAEARRIKSLPQKFDKQAALLARWQAQGIETVIRTDPRYPKRLSQNLPPAQQPLVVWARGAMQLFDEPGVAVLGSQDPDEATAEQMDHLMPALAAEGIGLISGYGRGLDRLTFETMLAGPGGQAVAVLPMGLAAFAKTTDKLEQAIEKKHVLLVSPFPPDTPFDDKLADARNLLIDHLALALLIPDADETTVQERAGAALSRGMPVFVGLTDTTGNRALIEMGALLLTDAGEVAELVQQAIIDTTLSEPVQEESVTPIAPPAQPMLDANEDYSLRTEDVDPIDSDEALEILSMGGEIPDILRRRLHEADDEDTNE
jgi:predicted Rossmann fold nucleotide-binding protein DprA/Smf involved in DNA uptake